MESATREDGVIRPFSGETSIFITPGYRFRAVDVMMTNFHLPRSTLFMLVCGLQRARRDEARLRARDRGRLPLLFLRRRVPAVPVTRMTGFSFEVLHTDGDARAGEIRTPRGTVRTPAFMPVGTQGALKGVHWHEVREAGADIVLGNTYHLMLRPGAERIAALGGLHRFINWPHPILTDSGGFQVMSLASLRKVDENGVAFRSHLDGATVDLTPERAIEIQQLLGSDISMQLDECLKLPAEAAEIARAMRLSLRWAERCKRAFEQAPAGRALFGIVQGGDDKTLRHESARALVDMGFDGYAIGGLAVGEPQEIMLAMIEAVVPQLPAERPHYLMGVGTPDDILQAVARGIDMFDCVLPTRNGRHGLAFTRFGPINLKNARHADRPATARCGEPLSGGPRLFPCLPTSSREGERDARRHAAQRRQLVLLPGSHAGYPRIHCRRQACGVRRHGPRRLGARGGAVTSGRHWTDREAARYVGITRAATVEAGRNGGQAQCRPSDI